MISLRLRLLATIKHIMCVQFSSCHQLIIALFKIAIKIMSCILTLKKNSTHLDFWSLLNIFLQKKRIEMRFLVANSLNWSSIDDNLDDIICCSVISVGRLDDCLNTIRKNIHRRTNLNWILSIFEASASHHIWLEAMVSFLPVVPEENGS